MENSGDILSSLLQNPETLNLIAGIAKSFLSANVNTAKNTETTSPAANAAQQSEKTVTDSQSNAETGDFPSSSVSAEQGNSAETSDVLSAAVKAAAVLSGSGNPPSPSPQGTASEQPLNASAVIDAPHAHNSFDERANLLRSIKPYLKDDRQQKVDSLVKALNIAKLINSYTGSAGLFWK